jgi:hypothetical protein
MTRMKELTDMCQLLGDIELDVVLEIARRVFAGQNAYGLFLKADTRDFRREAEDEALDMAVYCARRLHQKKVG